MHHVRTTPLFRVRGLLDRRGLRIGRRRLGNILIVIGPTVRRVAIALRLVIRIAIRLLAVTPWFGVWRQRTHGDRHFLRADVSTRPSIPTRVQ
jgi:hypothetical protein